MAPLQHSLALLRAPVRSLAATLAFAPLLAGCQPERASEPVDDAPEEAAGAREPSAAARVPEREPAAADRELGGGAASPGGGSAGEPGAGSAAAESGEAEASDSEGEAQAAAPAPEGAAAPRFAACVSSSGPYSDCDTLYLAVIESSPARCIQLTLDNCGTYGRQGLAADAPSGWRVASGAVGEGEGPCELGTFYPGNRSVADATGSITWSESTRLPSEVVFELTLELSAVGGEAEAIEVATSEPLQPIECAD